LDIADSASIEQFTQQLYSDYPSIDILVNNAAIAYKAADPTPFAKQARPTITTNYFGTVQLTDALLPLLEKSEQSYPRIVNVASEVGHLKILKSQALKAK
jgi:carbonyl reductase 1